MAEDFLSHQALGKDILAHHGVLGMKWGQRKDGTDVSAPKLARLNKSADKGEKSLAKNGGDADKAILKRSAVDIGAIVGTHVLANVIGNASGSKEVAVGAKAIANVASVVIVARGLTKDNQVRNAANRAANSNGR